MPSIAARLATCPPEPSRDKTSLMDRSGQMLRASGWSEVRAAREAGYPERRTGAKSRHDSSDRSSLGACRLWPSGPDSRDGDGSPRSSGRASTGRSAPGNELDRIILYLPARSLDLAEALAEKAGIPAIQDYCGRLLNQALESEKDRQKVIEIEARRGPLEGLKQIAADPDYLAEWQVESESRPAPRPPVPGDTIAVDFVLADAPEVQAPAASESEGVQWIEATPDDDRPALPGEAGLATGSDLRGDAGAGPAIDGRHRQPTGPRGPLAARRIRRG